jgi:predicted nucleic acid-binding protein
VSAIASWLRTLSKEGNLEFWPEDVSLLDNQIFALDLVMGPRQLTDVYLLGLAMKHGGQLVTFDRSIPWRAVRGAKASHLKILVS